MAIGNPWGAAAQSYGQDLDQLTKIQMGGMQQAAQMPLQLYDRFMDGYEKARQRAAAEKAEELRQAQLDRQNRIAEETMRHNQSTELFNRDRLMQQDEISQLDRSAKWIKENITDSFSGDPEMAKGLEEAARQQKIRGAVEMLKSMKVGAKPADPALQSALGEEGLMAPDQAYATPESYKPGTGYQMKKAQQEEAERKAKEGLQFEKDKLGLTLAQQKAIAEQASADRRFLGGLAAAGRNDARDAKELARQEKLRTARLQDEAALYGVDDSLDKLNRGIEELKKHPGFEAMIGKSSIAGHIPYTDAADARAKLQTIKNNLWMDAMSAMRSEKTGATGLGQITEPENRRIEGLIATIDPDKMTAEGIKDAIDGVQRWINETKVRKRTFLDIKHGGGQGQSPAPPAPSGEASARAEFNALPKNQQTPENKLRIMNKYGLK